MLIIIINTIRNKYKYIIYKAQKINLLLIRIIKKSFKKIINKKRIKEKIKYLYYNNIIKKIRMHKKEEKRSKIKR